MKESIKWAACDGQRGYFGIEVKEYIAYNSYEIMNISEYVVHKFS